MFKSYTFKNVFIIKIITLFYKIKLYYEDNVFKRCTIHTTTCRTVNICVCMNHLFCLISFAYSFCDIIFMDHAL